MIKLRKAVAALKSILKIQSGEYEAKSIDDVYEPVGCSGCEDMHVIAELALYEIEKHTTNADLLRTMSNRHLADMLHKGTCPPVRTRKFCDTMECHKCWMTWLRSKANRKEVEELW